MLAQSPISGVTLPFGPKRKIGKKRGKKEKKKVFFVFSPYFFHFGTKGDGIITGTAMVGCNRFPLGDFKHF